MNKYEVRLYQETIQEAIIVVEAENEEAAKVQAEAKVKDEDYKIVVFTDHFGVDVKLLNETKV